MKQFTDMKVAKDFETWRQENYEWLELSSWSEDAQYLIYEGTELLHLNGLWIIDRLSHNDYMTIYQRYILKAKDSDYADVELLQKYRNRLYTYCTNMLRDYCLD